MEEHDVGSAEARNLRINTTEGVLLNVAYAFDAFRDHGDWVVVLNDETRSINEMAKAFVVRLESEVGPLYELPGRQVDNFGPVDFDRTHDFTIDSSELSLIQAVMDACFEHFDEEDFSIFFSYGRARGAELLRQLYSAVERAEGRR